MKVTFVVLLVACFVSFAAAADNHSYRAARPDVIPAGRVQVHPFVNVPATEAASTLIFASDYEDDTIWWYNTAGKLLGTLTSGLSNPQGLATDSKKNLYVANTGASTVLIYKSPYTKTPTTLSVSGYYPVGVAQFNDGEWVAVSNIFATSGENGSVSMYKKGKLIGQITNSAFYYYYFCGFDKAGNLYVDGRNSDGDIVVGWVPGAAKGKTTLDTLTYNNSIDFPGGIEVNTKNEPAILDQEGYAVYTYKGVKNGSLGTPVETTSLSGVGDPVTYAFTSTGKDLWEADAEDLNLGEYAYPAGGSAIDTISPSGAALLIGAAVVPAEKP